VLGKGPGERQKVRKSSAYDVTTPQQAKLLNFHFPLNVLTIIC